MFLFGFGCGSTTGKPVVEVDGVIDGTAFLGREVDGVKAVVVQEVMDCNCGAGSSALFGKHGAEGAEQRNVRGIWWAGFIPE